MDECQPGHLSEILSDFLKFIITAPISLVVVYYASLTLCIGYNTGRASGRVWGWHLSVKQENKSPIQVHSLAHSYSYVRELCKEEGLAYLLHPLPFHEQGFYPEDCTTSSGLGNIISCPDDGGSKSMRSAATLLPDHMAGNPRKQ
jgi:hypothetical protein